MDAFLAALTPADIVRLKELVVLSYLAGFGILAICRFILRLFRQPATWRSFFTSPSFLVAAAGALVALAIYLQLPPTELGTDPVVSEDEVLWGMNKADALNLIEIVVLATFAMVFALFGVQPVLHTLMHAAFALIRSRFPKQPVPTPSGPLSRGKLLILAAAFGGMVYFLWLFITRNNKVSIDSIAATVTEESPRLYGLTKSQLLGIAEMGVLTLVAIMLVWLVVRPLLKRALATFGVLSNQARLTLNWSAIACSVVVVLLCLWRVYEIASL